MKKLGNVISNSSPIIGLSMLGLIELLWQLFQQVYVTEAVYDEVVNKGKNNTGAKELAKAVNNNKIKVYKVKDKYLIENFLGKLHKGELEVIAAAKEFNNKPYILLDDKAARYLAERLLLEPTGLIGFLRIAKVYGKIESIKYYLDQLIDNNFRISKKLYLEKITNKIAFKKIIPYHSNGKGLFFSSNSCLITFSPHHRNHIFSSTQ